jgi:hypothetical protein
MRNGDVRRACLALVHNRARAAVPAADPLPVALGWHLERAGTSLSAMTALCAGALADATPGARWQPSAALRGLLGEYGAVRRERGPLERVVHTRNGAQAARAADALH